MSVQGRQARVRGTPFGLINGATAVDAVVLDVPAGVEVDGAVHVLYISTGVAPAQHKRVLHGRL